MGFSDLLKHQSVSGICAKFIKSINEKHNNKITIGDYIIERFVHKDINCCFGLNGGIYTPFYKTIKKTDNFDIFFYDKEPFTGYAAISHAKHINRLGIIINTSNYECNNLYNSMRIVYYSHAPIIFISFYDRANESKLTQNLIPQCKFLKQQYTINDSIRFPNLLEYMMYTAELPQKGPVHLKICNDILNHPVDFSKIYVETIDNKISKNNENLSLLQYYEKQYELLENNDR